MSNVEIIILLRYAALVVGLAGLLAAIWIACASVNLLRRIKEQAESQAHIDHLYNPNHYPFRMNTDDTDT